MRVTTKAAILAVGLLSPAVAQETSCTADLREFNQLKTGMSYRQVAGIIGCAGSLLSSSDMAGYKSEMFMWEGAGTLGANMNALFQNGKMMMKSQYGLQ